MDRQLVRDFEGSDSVEPYHRVYCVDAPHATPQLGPPPR